MENGLVITDDIDSEGYSTGNEWVWVPVNSTVGNADYYATESSATALAGATSVTYTKYSKFYSFVGTRRDSEGFYPISHSKKESISKPSQSINPGHREIAILTHSTYGEGANYSSIIKRTTNEVFTSTEGVTGVAKQYKNDYERMVASANKYHGFYIGRYELANISGTAKEQPGNSYTNETWYLLYNKCLTLNKGTNTETSMMYGALWDVTMQWLAKSNISVGYTATNKSGYGNYKAEDVKVSNNKETNSTTIKVKASGTGTKLQTGQTSYTCKKNIYDLSGNCYDWSQEANQTDYRVLRGGYYYDNSSDYTYSAGRNDGIPTYSGDDASSRPQLYIK